MKQFEARKQPRVARKLVGFTLILQIAILLTACDGPKQPVLNSISPKNDNPANSFSQMIDNLPDNADGSTNIIYNNFGSIFGLYGISEVSFKDGKPDTKIVEKISGGNPPLLMSAFSNLKASGASNFYTVNDQMNAFGWSRFNVISEIYNEKSPSGKYDEIYVLRGRFDPKAIDTALLTKGYQKEQATNGTVYSIGKDGSIDPKASVFQFRIGYDNIGVVADGSAIIASGYKAQVLKELPLFNLNNSQPAKTLSENPAVKAMATAFGPAQMVYIYDTNAYAARDINNLGTYDFRNLFNVPDKQARAVKLAQELPDFPAAKTAGLAYYEPKRGERYYLLATYYDTPEQAQQAKPALERLLKEGYPFNSGAFYGGRDFNEYSTLVTSDQKDNLLIFKLKFSNDVVIFTPSELDYPLSYFKSK